MKQPAILFLTVFLLGWTILFIDTKPVYATEQGISDSRIIIGTSVPLTGHAAHLGHAIVTGMRAYFNRINNEGGIFGRKIELIAYDDDYNPPLMISNVRKLIMEDNVFALIGLVGTPTTLSVVKETRKHNIPLLFPFTGAIELRRPIKENIINLRPSYWDECAAVIDYFIKHGKTRFTVFYQNDAYGLNGRNGVERRLIRHDLDIITEASYIRGVPEVQSQVQKVKKYNPDVIVMIGTADACSAFIREAVKVGMKDVWFSNVSVVNAHELKRKLGDSEATVFVSEVLPPVSDTSYPAVREYRQLMNKFFPASQLNQVSFEGFLNARLFVKAMKDMGNKPERKNLIRIFQDMDEIDIGIGENVNFSRIDHQGLDKVYITRIENGKIIYIQN